MFNKMLDTLKNDFDDSLSVCIRLKRKIKCLSELFFLLGSIIIFVCKYIRVKREYVFLDDLV